MSESSDIDRPERIDHIYGAQNIRVTAKTRLGEICVCIESFPKDRNY